MTNKNYCTLYIARHGQTEWNEKGILMGHKDSPLTDLGIQQAHGLARALADVHFDAIFSSDLLRAQRTAEIVKLERDLAIQTTHMLRERSCGDYEGLPHNAYGDAKAKLIKDLNLLTNAEKKALKLAPNTESVDEHIARLITFIREVAVAYAGKTLLLMTHGGGMRNLLTHFGWANDEELPPGSLDNCAYFILESDGVDFFIKKTVGINKQEKQTLKI